MDVWESYLTSLTNEGGGAATDNNNNSKPQQLLPHLKAGRQFSGASVATTESTDR